MTGGPVILLDVDGVVNLGRFMPSKKRNHVLFHERGQWFHRKPPPGTNDRILVNLTRVRAAVGVLAASGAELAWATTWGHEANVQFGWMLGLPQLPVAPVNMRNLSRKAWTVIPWLEGRPWAWLEDQQEELTAARSITPGDVPCLPVLVDRSTGLTEDHAVDVIQWLDSLYSLSRKAVS